MTDLVSVERVSEELGGATVLRGDTYRDQSVLFAIPTRGGIHPKVVEHWLGLAKPFNHRSGFVINVNDEVGVAYNKMIEAALSRPELAGFSHVMTLEDDNLVPPNAVLQLFDTLHAGGWDAVGGLYFMKGPRAVPMAFGRPDVRDADGQLDMTPRDLTDAIIAGETVEVNGLACGCTLWRLDMFRELDPPWFETLTRFHNNGVVEMSTQDMFFCRRAREAGKRFAVDTRVRVGHMDVATGEVY